MFDSTPWRVVSTWARPKKQREELLRQGSAASLQCHQPSDGMGGQAHGEVASKLAVETVLTHCRQAENSRATPIFGESRPDVTERTNRLASAIHLANRKVFETAASNPEQQGMGATIVAAWVDGQRLSLAHVGDSRVYLLRGGTMDQLTADLFAGGRKSARRDPDSAGSRCERNAKRVDARGGDNQFGGVDDRRTGLALAY